MTQATTDHSTRPADDIEALLPSWEVYLRARNLREKTGRNHLEPAGLIRAL